MLLSSVILLGCQDSVTPLLKYLPVVYIPYTCLPPISLRVFLMPFLAIIWVDFTSTASLCMSCIKYFLFSPVLVVNWVSYVFPPNFISKRSTPFPDLAPLGLVFVFSRSLVFRSPASIYLLSWFVFISYVFSMSSSSVSFFWDVIFYGGVFLVVLVLIFDDSVTWIILPVWWGLTSYVSSTVLSSSSPFSLMSSSC